MKLRNEETVAFLTRLNKPGNPLLLGDTRAKQNERQGAGCSTPEGSSGSALWFEETPEHVRGYSVIPWRGGARAEGGVPRGAPGCPSPPPSSALASVAKGSDSKYCASSRGPCCEHTVGYRCRTGVSWNWKALSWTWGPPESKCVGVRSELHTGPDAVVRV